MQYHDDALTPGSAMEKKLNHRVDVSLRTRRPQMIIMQQAGAIAQFDAREGLGSLPRGLPVLLIQGKHDRMVDYDEARLIEEHIPQARRYVPPAGEAFGHMWFDYFDLDAAWVAPITAFLDAARAKL